MSFGVYLAAIGYEHHGPKGHLGFAPRIGPEDFRCAFTAAEGWGSYRQTRRGRRLAAEVEVRHGDLRLATLSFETNEPARHVTVRYGGRRIPAEVAADGTRAVVTLGTPVKIAKGQTIGVELT